MQIHLKLPAPHSKEQGQIIRAFKTDHLLEMWVACGTKFGKTLAGSEAMCMVLPVKQQGVFRWVAPTFSQSHIGLRYIKRMLPPEPYTITTTHNIKMKGLDSVLEFRSGDIPENLEGEACSGYVLDECAKLKEEVYSSAKTTVTVTRGPIIGLSTPRGKNWFYRKCMEAKEHMAWAIKNDRPLEKVFITAKTALNPKVSLKSIEDAKRSLNSRLYQQYYEAEFVENGSIFNFLNEAFEDATDFSDEEVFYPEPHDSSVIYIGADWAKLEDYTVFVAINDKGRMVGFKHFHKKSYLLQVKDLWEFIRVICNNSTNKQPHVEVLHDKTGVGEAIDDIIESTNPGHNVGGLVWNNTNKEMCVNDLILSLEEIALKLIPIRVLKDEMTAFEVKVGLSGRFKYAAPEGQHDDTVMALVLANNMFRENKGKDFSATVLHTIENLVMRTHYHGGVLEYD